MLKVPIDSSLLSVCRLSNQKSPNSLQVATTRTKAKFRSTALVVYKYMITYSISFFLLIINVVNSIRQQSVNNLFCQFRRHVSSHLPG